MSRGGAESQSIEYTPDRSLAHPFLGLVERLGGKVTVPQIRNWVMSLNTMTAADSRQISTAVRGVMSFYQELGFVQREGRGYVLTDVGCMAAQAKETDSGTGIVLTYGRVPRAPDADGYTEDPGAVGTDIMKVFEDARWRDQYCKVSLILVGY